MSETNGRLATLATQAAARPEQAELLGFLFAIRNVLDIFDDNPEMALLMLTNMLGAFMRERSPKAGP